MKIIQVISGGQTGVDTAGLLAARKLGIKTGGWAPKGYRTEIGPRREFLQSFGLKEHRSKEYPPRTAANIHDADFTLIIAEHYDKGSKLTAKLCFSMKKPVFHTVLIDIYNDPHDVNFNELVSWIRARKLKKAIINIAGNRESRSPGIQKAAKRFLVRLFKALEDV